MVGPDEPRNPRELSRHEEWGAAQWVTRLFAGCRWAPPFTPRGGWQLMRVLLGTDGGVPLGPGAAVMRCLEGNPQHCGLPIGSAGRRLRWNVRGRGVCDPGPPLRPSNGLRGPTAIPRAPRGGQPGRHGESTDKDKDKGASKISPPPPPGGAGGSSVQWHR